MNNEKRKLFFVLAFIAILIILIIGFALYVYPKNYDILQIDAKTDNYSVVGFAIGFFTLIISICIFTVTISKKNKWRIFFGIELLLSIMLLFLWGRY